MAAIVPRRAEDLMQEAAIRFAGQHARATDWTPGAVVRTLLEAVALMTEKTSVGFVTALNYAIDNAVFDAFNIARRPATPATGLVRCTKALGITGAVTIPQGAQFRVPGSTTQVYEAVSATTLAAGAADGDVRVQCLVPGTVGNVAAGLITELVTPIPGIAAVTNLKPFVNGRDLATDAERRADFTARLLALARGTLDALDQGVRTAALTDAEGTVLEAVRKAAIVEGPYTPPAGSTGQPLAAGQVAIYVHNGVGGTATSLVQQAQQVVDGYIDARGVEHPGYRPVGVQCTVYAATEQALAVTCQITAYSPGYVASQVVPQVQSALQGVADALDVGETLYVNALRAAIRGVPGVLDFTLSLSSNVQPQDRNYLIVPTFTVS